MRLFCKGIEDLQRTGISVTRTPLQWQLTGNRQRACAAQTWQTVIYGDVHVISVSVTLCLVDKHV